MTVNKESRARPYVRMFNLLFDIFADIVIPLGLGILLVELLPFTSKIGIYILAFGVFIRIVNKQVKSYYLGDTTKD